MVVLLLLLGLVSSVGVAWAGATMFRGGVPDNVLTNTWFNEPTVEMGEVNDWRIAQWTDATLTRRWGWGWRPEWMADPCISELRRMSSGKWDGGRTIEGLVLPAFTRAMESPEEVAPHYAIYVDALPSFEEREAGWPARCLRVWWVAGDDRLDTPGERIRGGMLASYWAYRWGGILHHSMIGWDTEGEHALPLTPMWGGLLINTIAWAAIWFVVLQLVMLPVWLWLRWRRKRRERTGRCAGCGYVLGAARDPIVTCPECGMAMGCRPRWAWRGMVALPALALVLAMMWASGVAAQRVVTAEHLPPLYQAAADGDADLVRSLLVAGTPVDDPAPEFRPLGTSPMQGARAIEWAAMRGHAGVVDALLNAGAAPSMVGMVGDDRSPLALAIACGHGDVVDRLLAARASVLDQPKTTPSPIAIAAWHDDAALLERLFDEADAAGAGPVPLELFDIVLAGRSAMVQRMVLDRASASPQATADIAIGASRWGDLGLLDALIARGFDPAPVSGGLFWGVVRTDDSPLSIDDLVSRGADPMVTDRLGNTLLHTVASYGDRPAVVRRLVELGVPLEATNNNQRTALHRAAIEGHDENVRVLLDAGADATAVDAQGRTPRDLWWHARRGTEGYEEVRELLEAAGGAP